MADTNKKLNTDYKITWCPGCPNFRILEAAKIALTSMMKQGAKQTDFCMVSGIGCHGKIFDYLNISGFYGLHGRSIPTATGIKIGNPNLKVLVFAGDGDTYSEGMSHFIHACKSNPNITLCVHDNQSFSLTTGQITPTSQMGFKSKAEPLGKQYPPSNPLRLALAAGATFVARANARDPTHTATIMEAAMKHNGFSFVEIVQDCIVFNVEMNNRDKNMYYLDSPCKTRDDAIKLAGEYDYNKGEGKIALGVVFQEKRNALHDNWPQLQNLVKLKKSWKQFKK